MITNPRATDPIGRWRAVRDAAARADVPSMAVQWSSDGSAVRGRLTGQDWISLDLDGRAARPAVDRARLAAAVAAEGLDPGAITELEVDSADFARVTVGGRHFRLALPTCTLTPLRLAEIEAAEGRRPRLVREAAIDGWAECHELLSPCDEVLLTEIGENLGLRFVVDNRKPAAYHRWRNPLRVAAGVSGLVARRSSGLRPPDRLPAGAADPGPPLP